MPPSKRARRAPAEARPSAPTHNLIADTDARLTISDELALLWQDKKLCDVMLVVDDEELVPAHMIVLAAGCGYFRAMSSERWSEGTGGRVLLRELNANGVLAVVTFLYTGRVEFTPDSLPHIMQAASRLDAISLLVQAAKFLMHHLEPENCLATHEVCSALARPELVSLLAECEQVFLRSFLEVSATSNFLHAPALLMGRILSSDDLDADEDKVFDAFKRWHDAQPPGDEHADLLQHLRLEHMSPENLQRIESDVVALSPRGHELMMTAYRSHAIPGSAQSKPRGIPPWLTQWDPEVHVSPEIEGLWPFLSDDGGTFNLQGRDGPHHNEATNAESSWTTANVFSMPVRHGNIVWAFEVVLAEGVIASDQLAIAVSSDKFPLSSTLEPLRDIGEVSAVLLDLDAFWNAAEAGELTRFMFYVSVEPARTTAPGAAKNTVTVTVRDTAFNALMSREMPTCPQYRLVLCATYCNAFMTLKHVYGSIDAARAAL
jgi:hypothetical protein